MKHIKHQFNDNSLILEQIEPVILISNEVISSFYFIFQIRQYFKGKERKKKNGLRLWKSQSGLFFNSLIASFCLITSLGGWRIDIFILPYFILLVGYLWP